MVQEGWTAGAAAYEAGFSDQAHLSRCLAQSFGFSPGTLRAARKSLFPSGFNRSRLSAAPLST
jgi:AraC-like DNA-binding protein